MYLIRLGIVMTFKWILYVYIHLGTMNMVGTCCVVINISYLVMKTFHLKVNHIMLHLLAYKLILSIGYFLIASFPIYRNGIGVKNPWLCRGVVGVGPSGGTGGGAARGGGRAAGVSVVRWTAGPPHRPSSISGSVARFQPSEQAECALCRITSRLRSIIRISHFFLGSLHRCMDRTIPRCLSALHHPYIHKVNIRLAFDVVAIIPWFH